MNPEICICAAVMMNDGYIIRGHRHSDCILTAARMHDLVYISQKQQGFLTTHNRFVGREEAAKLQKAAGIKSIRGGNVGSRLYSEDLY